MKLNIGSLLEVGTPPFCTNAISLLLDDYAVVTFLKDTLPETNIAPGNGWLEYETIGFRPIFRRKLAVSFREGN